MTAQIIKFPKPYREAKPRYKVAWCNEADTGFVEDKATGGDWESSEEWEASYVAFVMEEQYRDTQAIFWVHNCSEYQC